MEEMWSVIRNTGHEFTVCSTFRSGDKHIKG